MSARLPIDATTDSKNPSFETAAASFRRRSLALRPLRLVLLACGLVALLIGLWAGIARLGIGLIGAAPQFVKFHGALLICGFFGTLISVERAVAINRPLAYIIPVFAATGVVALLARTLNLAGGSFLIASGFELLARPLHLPAFWYDAVVHAVTLGFVLSMVFGHTLIIFPSVAGFTLRYSPALYVPLLLLQISIGIRMIGDFSGWTGIRLGSGSVTIVALVCFAATIVVVSIWNRSDAQRSTAKVA
jgi:hypothetical protein